MDVWTAIRLAESLLPGRAAPEGEADPRWAAIFEVGEYIESEPEAVWSFIERWGGHDDQDTRSAIAAGLLEHLLAVHFEAFFPRVEQRALSEPLFGDMVMICAEMGEADRGPNRAAMLELKRRVRANRAKPRRRSRLYSDWFFDEWWEACPRGFHHGPPLPLDQQLQIWEGFWQRTFVNGKWTVPIGDAGTLIMDGVYLCLEGRQFEDGIRLLDHLFEHPDVTLLDSITLAKAVEFRGICEIMLGKLEVASGRLQDVCTDGHMVHSIASWLLLLQEHRPGFDPELKPLVSFLVGRYFHSKPLLKELEATSSNEAMFTILERAAENKTRPFPRRPKPQN